MDEQIKTNLRHELRVLLGKMNLRDDAKVEKCIDILGVEPEVKAEPEIIITDKPKKRKKNSGDPE